MIEVRRSNDALFQLHWRMFAGFILFCLPFLGLLYLLLHLYLPRPAWNDFSFENTLAFVALSLLFILFFYLCSVMVVDVFVHGWADVASMSWSADDVHEWYESVWAWSQSQTLWTPEVVKSSPPIIPPNSLSSGSNWTCPIRQTSSPGLGLSLLFEIWTFIWTWEKHFNCNSMCEFKIYGLLSQQSVWSTSPCGPAEDPLSAWPSAVLLP